MTDKYPNHRTRRLERCQSWIDKAKAHEDDPDIAFIFFWVAFNALYAEDVGVNPNDTKNREKFIKAICKQDGQENRIYDQIWTKFSGSIRTLIKNPYAYRYFWEWRNGNMSEEESKKRKEKDDKKFLEAFGGTKGKQNTVIILKHLFSRLYVLRNQIMHGGATYESYRNRDSVNDGHQILLSLVPLFLDIVEKNPSIDLGKPYYFAEDK